MIITASPFNSNAESVYTKIIQTCIDAGDAVFETCVAGRGFFVSVVDAVINLVTKIALSVLASEIKTETANMASLSVAMSMWR